MVNLGAALAADLGVIRATGAASPGHHRGGFLTRKQWVRTEIAAGTMYTVAPLFHFGMAVQHTAAMGTTLALLSPLWVLFLGPGPALAVTASRQATRPTTVWPLFLCGALMATWATFALWSFSRQGDVHWLLWTLWSLAAASSVVALAGAIALQAANEVVDGAV